MLNPPSYVKPGQIFMCRFEHCWDSSNARLCADKTIIANVRPEIGKIRPVIVVYAHKRLRLALVVPFTTQAPLRDVPFTVFISQGAMPGILAKKECWALCDMLKTVSLDRLHKPFCGKKNLSVNYKATTLDSVKFAEIRSAAKSIF